MTSIPKYEWRDAKINYIDVRKRSDGTPEYYVEFSVNDILSFRASYISFSESFASLTSGSSVRLLLNYNRNRNPVVCEIWKKEEKDGLLQNALYPFSDGKFSPDNIRRHSPA